MWCWKQAKKIQEKKGQKRTNRVLMVGEKGEKVSGE